MKYTKLILCGYKRIKRKRIEYLEINPTDPVQLILGTNGSGKSSVMGELSPLPGDKGDFDKTGYKEIHISKDADTYILKSTFDPKPEHSFIKNGVELNQGRTVSVQKELVKKDFNYSQEIHEILTSSRKFCRMQTSERRYWLTMLSNNSYDYIIKVYKRLKDRHRDVQGAVKTLKKRLVLETEKIIDAREQERIEAEIAEMHDFLSRMLEVRKPLEKSFDQAEVEATDIYINMGVANTMLIEAKQKIGRYGDYSIDEIDTQVATATADHRVASLQVEDLAQEFDKVDESIRILKQTNHQSNAQIAAKVIELKNKQSAIVSQKTIFLGVSGLPDNALSALETITDILRETALALPANTEKFFSRATATLANTNLTILQTSRNEIEKALNALQATKRHQEMHRGSDEIECPSCRFKWHKGFSQAIYDEAIEKIEFQEKRLETVAKEILHNEDILERVKEYTNQYRSLMDIVKAWPILKEFWDHILDESILMGNPGSISDLINEYKRSLLIDREFYTLQAEIDRQLELIRLSAKVEDQSLEELTARRQEIEEKLQTLSGTIEKSMRVKNEWSTYKADRLYIEKTTNQLNALIASHDKNYEEKREIKRRMIFNEFIVQFQRTLGMREMAIGEIRNQRSIVIDIETQIMALEQDEQSLKILTNELSPTDGLIAEGLFGFIKVFVQKLNFFIDKSWTYPLEIIPCMAEEDEGDGVELSYRFPIARPEDPSNPVPDISNGSTGQQQIIDLAFVVTFMEQLGLDNSPLMLDEFGAGLDSKHRVQTTATIKSLIEQHPFTQLFMVSHYDSVYGAFTNAQVMVLCDENVVVPKDSTVNKHVIIR